MENNKVYYVVPVIDYEGDYANAGRLFFEKADALAYAEELREDECFYDGIDVREMQVY